jgi:hypothetical protein
MSPEGYPKEEQRTLGQPKFSKGREIYRKNTLEKQTKEMKKKEKKHAEKQHEKPKKSRKKRPKKAKLIIPLDPSNSGRNPGITTGENLADQSEKRPKKAKKKGGK